ncbi:MAG: N-acetylmuramoyl-L-alanine amidase [Saprospiraceae bacterium]|nr:N-acetylmuramoyl-L-alanine amidase [Saprospiraceae bacterium]
MRHIHENIIKILLIFVCLLPLSSFQGKTPTRQFLIVKLERSMSIDELLRKYLLNEYDCNVQQFLKLNNISSRKSPLSKNGVYNLPVWVYDFNGKSIRSSVNITDLDVAKMIQSYNTDLLKNGNRKQTYQENNLLLVPYHALTCPKSRSKESSSPQEPEFVEGSEKVRGIATKTYAIFGRKYQDVPIVDKKLKGKIFYVEGGHGGPDPGAMTKVSGRSLCEDEYAYDVSLRIARELIMHSAIVYIITRDNNDGIRDGDFLMCDSDERTYPDQRIPLAHKPRLTQRSDAINEIYEKHRKQGITDQRLIVIHVDSRGKAQQTDTFLYYQNGNESSLKIAKRMQQTLETKYARYRDYKGTLTTRDLHMLRECKPNTVYVELGNLRNEFDRKRLMIKNNRQAIASWLAEGFMK